MEIFTKICHCDEEELSNKNCTGPAVCEGCGRNICYKEKKQTNFNGSNEKNVDFCYSCQVDKTGLRRDDLFIPARNPI